ncbi:MAG TPA: tetratricopeptide repeat protein [Opitutales bacterium]|nr:tetratricopeptide repeat protein [Opitutales bacterium]
MAKDDNEFQIGFYEGVLRHNPHDQEVIELLGGLYTKQGRVDEGLRMDRKLVRLAPENPIAHYNLACSLALKRRKADAVRALRRAVETGYRDLQWLREDPDLASLRGHAGFRAVEADVARLLASEPKEPQS